MKLKASYRNFTSPSFCHHKKPWKNTRIAKIISLRFITKTRTICTWTMECQYYSIYTDPELEYSPEHVWQSTLVRLALQVGWSSTKARLTLLWKKEVRKPASSTRNPINLSSTKDMPVIRWLRKSDQLSQVPNKTQWVIVVLRQETSTNERAQSRLTPYRSISNPLLAFKTLPHKPERDTKSTTRQIIRMQVNTSFE